MRSLSVIRRNNNLFLRHAQKARINSDDALATALGHIQSRLKHVAEQESDLDSEIQACPNQTDCCVSVK